MTRRIRLTMDISTDRGEPDYVGGLVAISLPDGITLLNRTARELPDPQKRGPKPISDATRDDVISLRLAGSSYPAIAEAVGLSRTTVINICRADT